MSSLIGGTVILCTEKMPHFHNVMFFMCLLAVYQCHVLHEQKVHLHTLNQSKQHCLALGASLHSPAVQSEMLGGCQDRVS